MSTYADHLLNQFRSRGALVDTNLLLLLLVGSYNRDLLNVSGFKRVAAYSVEDWAALVALLKQFKVSVTTPHILTEVSNLAGQLPDHHKSGCFKKYVELFRTFTELTGTSIDAISRPEFPYVGLTDCVIAEAASSYLVITDDLRFCNTLANAGLTALNFNHVRTLAWK